jgi:hypothetical protein
MEVQVFNDVTLAIKFKDELIMGKLNGSLLYWEFTSSNPLFNVYFPNGKLTKHTLYHTLSDNSIQLVEEFYHSANSLFQ